MHPSWLAGRRSACWQRTLHELLCLTALSCPLLPACYCLDCAVLQVPQLYKRLKYPFQISKSNLTAVGSPHTWPSLLAALT